MRNNLRKQENVRASFSGEFERYGHKTGWTGYPDPTILLKNIKDKNNNIVCDHLWFNLTKAFRSLSGLNQGDVVRFDARVKRYIKGYVNHREFIDERTLDYKLSHPTKVLKG